MECAGQAFLEAGLFFDLGLRGGVIGEFVAFTTGLLVERGVAFPHTSWSLSP